MKSASGRKTKLTLAVLLGLLTLAFVYRNESNFTKEASSNVNVINLNAKPPAPAHNNISADFLIGAMTNGWQTDYSKLTDTLGFNLWHRYIDGGLDNGQFLIKGWTSNDYLDADINVYRSDVQGILDNNFGSNMRTLMERPKVTRLAFGQRSDYQCESTNLNPDLWFYSYSNHQVGIDEYDDNQSYGSNSWVRYCEVNNNQTDGGAGWVVSGLKSNHEQVNMSVRWEGDKSYSWIVKPKIRADKNYIDNHSDEPICRIDVINYDNNLIKSTIIRARNFKDQNGDYDGKYKEEGFNFLTPNDSDLTFSQTEAINFNPRNKFFWVPNGECKADFKVYWYGNCDMWIDYVRVDNDVADRLLKGNDAEYESWLEWEAEEIATHNNSPLKFYIEEFEFNNLPCMAYVSRKLRDVNPNIGLMCDLNYTLYNTVAPFSSWGNEFDNFVGVEHVKRYLIDSVGSTEVFMGAYPLSGYDAGGNAFEQNPIPVTLCGNQTYNWQTGMLTHSVPVSAYEDTLQAHFDTKQHQYWSYRMNTARADSLSKLANIPFINIFQTHLWFQPGHKLREPTNEEMDLMANLAVTYGARGILHFWYEAWGCLPSTNAGLTYARGLTEPLPCNTPNPFDWIDNPHSVTYDARTENVYGQNKWQKIIDMNTRLKAWGPTLMSFDNTNRHSYIYRLERNDLLANSYFADVVSYVRGNDHPICDLDAPDTTDAPTPPNLRYECFEDRYLQVATFKESLDDPDNYFMIVNRRCAPKQDVTHNDGERYIRVFFKHDAVEFQSFSNWNIVDVATNEIIPVNFNTNLNPYADLNWFDPGEGKLYKMIPTVKAGGILAGEENISGESFTCEAPVYNNGHNITIGANTTIHFNDSSKFVMNGGVFTVGDQNTSAPQNISSDAVPGGSWRGHSFTNCEVKIYGATFTGLANDTTYAVNIIDCPVVDIRNCTFNTNSSLKGGVNAVFYSDPNNEISLSNIYIGANTFNSSGSTIPTVNISSYAGETTPLIIENNTFNEGNTAIFLSGITGGAIKGNSITDNFIGINALTSQVDIKSNTISSTVNNAIGIFAAVGSELKMNNAGSKTLGGLNDLSNSGTAANNIVVDGSVFLLDGGQNIFNITDDQTSKHLYGYFPMFTAVSYDEKNNCFKLNSSPVDPPYNMVTTGFQGTQITFNFTPYLSGCDANDGGDGFAINLGDGIYDTIYNEGSGSGGSNKLIPLSRGVTAEGSRGVYVITTAKQRYDSISVLMRYRNYSQASTKCLDLINTYPDSIQSLNAVSKLFLSTVASDTSYNAVNELKIYYENLILNNSGNVSLVKRANYYILKCKVRMREYSQALAGFQQIINQNPYSYEGLIARWDYMATSLLIQGQGGAYSSADLETESSIDAVNALQREANDDDRSPFTKEQRQDIRKSINTAIEISKTEDDRKIKSLEDRSGQGDVNASKELSQMLTLKQVIKTNRPKSITEHVRIVTEDIRKVFGSNTSSKGNEPKNIPLVFRLSQNYPNPFNPVTKINYDLPKDSKVKIVIYDILGREVKRLVNSELKTAGSYIVDFNASNYASGVYFYRIEAEESNGNKFVDSKKMVLLK